MVDYSRISAIDRSKFFRHKKDYAILKAYLEERCLETPDVEWEPLDALVVGVGHLEEPLSILATCAETAKNLSESRIGVRLPRDLITLTLVDSRTRTEIKPIYSLGKGYGDANNPYPASFLTEEQRKTLSPHPLNSSRVSKYSAGFELIDGEYHFSEEVQREARAAMHKGNFSTRIQDFIAENCTQYPIIFFNNVITHLGAEGEQVAYDLTTKTLKDDGIIFMHHSKDICDSKGVCGTAKMITKNPKFAHLRKIGPAVYRRIIS